MHLASRFSTRLCTDQTGATAIEYGLLAALIALMITGSVGLLGSSIETTFGTLNAELSADAPNAEPEAAVAGDPSEQEKAAAAIAEADDFSELSKGAEAKTHAKTEETEAQKAEAQKADAQKAEPEPESQKKLGSQSGIKAISRTDRTGF